MRWSWLSKSTRKVQRTSTRRTGGFKPQMKNSNARLKLSALKKWAMQVLSLKASAVVLAVATLWISWVAQLWRIAWQAKVTLPLWTWWQGTLHPPWRTSLTDRWVYQSQCKTLSSAPKSRFFRRNQMDFNQKVRQTKTTTTTCWTISQVTATSE